MHIYGRDVTGISYYKHCKLTRRVWTDIISDTFAIIYCVPMCLLRLISVVRSGFHLVICFRTNCDRFSLPHQLISFSLSSIAHVLDIFREGTNPEQVTFVQQMKL